MLSISILFQWSHFYILLMVKTKRTKAEILMKQNSILIMESLFLYTF